MTLRSSPKESNKPVFTPPFPLAIRPDHIAKEQTSLYIRPKANPISATNYTVKDDLTGSILFTVTGQKHNHDPDRSSGREFRDASGLPLFELHRQFELSRLSISLSRQQWTVLLPGSNKNETLVSMIASWNRIHDFSLVFTNFAADDSKDSDGDKTVELNVHRTVLDIFLRWEITFGGRKVVDIRDSIERNKTVGRGLSGGYQGNVSPPKKVMDVTVAPGFDLTLAALATVIILERSCGERLE